MKKYKSIYISDIHLGMKRCKAKKLIRFLSEIETEKLFLVGDIIDFWELQKKNEQKKHRNKFFEKLQKKPENEGEWKHSHSEVLRKLLKLSEKGTEIIFIIGNHDELLRPLFKDVFQIGNSIFCNEYEYTSISGENILIIHGDQFDWSMLIPSGFMAFDNILPDGIYSKVVNKVTGWLNVKKRIRKFLQRHPQYDKVIYGHTHKPEIESDIINCGDWVHSCSYVVEDYNGNFQLKFYEPSKK